MTEIPYTISYGVTATDRNYGSPNGSSKQNGTLTFAASVWDEQLEIRLGNRNFDVRRNASNNERVVNFGNSSFGLTYAPNALQESNLWTDKRFYPSIVFDYEATIPTASRSSGLNVGRVDHDVTVVLEKRVGEKLALKNADGTLKPNFARRTRLEADFGVTFSANEGGGYNKTGNIVLVLKHTLLDINKSKYTYKGELSFTNLATGARAAIRALNRLAIKLDESGTTLGLGLITGISRDTPRVGFNASITFNGAFKIRKND